jgi:hypothetical protein
MFNLKSKTLFLNEKGTLVYELDLDGKHRLQLFSFHNYFVEKLEKFSGECLNIIPVSLDYISQFYFREGSVKKNPGGPGMNFHLNPQSKSLILKKHLG